MKTNLIYNIILLKRELLQSYYKAHSLHCYFKSGCLNCVTRSAHVSPSCPYYVTMLTAASSFRHKSIRRHHRFLWRVSLNPVQWRSKVSTAVVINKYTVRKSQTNVSTFIIKTTKNTYTLQQF